MATVKKTRTTVTKKVVKTSTIKTKKATASKPKKAVLPVKKEKITSKPVAVAKVDRAKPVAVAKVDRKPLQKLSPREEKLLQIKTKLLQQRAMLLNEAEVALNELPGQTIFPDLGDQATAETDRNFMLRLRGREQRLLKKIDQALERVEVGTFGICEDCGNEINLKRLEARPVTTMCIDCKTLQEEEEKLRES
jgi:DnaK suppressor protein